MLVSSYIISYSNSLDLFFSKSSRIVESGKISKRLTLSFLVFNSLVDKYLISKAMF
jgi:hypothetical protein